MTATDDQQLNLPNLELPLGLRLRRAREAMGLTVPEAAEKLRLRSATIEGLEKEDFESLGAAVYVRGYFSSYAKLVGVPVVLVDAAFARRELAPPQLRTTAHMSHTRYLFDRYAKRAVYLILTASIVVPVVLLATRNQLPRQGATLTPLDTPAVSEAGLSPGTAPIANTGLTADRPTGAEASGPPAPLARSAGETPVMAGLGPFYSSSFRAQTESAPAAVAPKGLSLHLQGDSWVEVLDAKGNRVEHGILRAGETRQFPVGAASRVSLGNAEAVEVRVNGAVTDISAYRRANVARFTVSSDGSLAPAGG